MGLEDGRAQVIKEMRATVLRDRAANLCPDEGLSSQTHPAAVGNETLRPGRT